MICLLLLLELTFEEQVGRNLQVEPRYAEEVIEQVFSALASQLEAGKEVRVRKFGEFYISVREGHYRTNPKTKEKYYLEERAYPRFRSFDSLKKRVRTTTSGPS